jgi:hypothetical protein
MMLSYTFDVPFSSNHRVMVSVSCTYCYFHAKLELGVYYNSFVISSMNQNSHLMP